MVRRKGNQLVLSLDIFDQLEIRHHFPFDVLKRNPIGYVNFDMVYLLYEEGKALVKVPFARNRLWFRAMVSDPEFSVLSKLPQIYVVSKRD